MLVTRAATPSLRAAGGGAIVNVSSGAASHTSPGMAPYACTKAALVMLTKQSAIDLGPEGIRVNAVTPGWTATEAANHGIDELVEAEGGDRYSAYRSVTAHQAIKRPGDPDEVAAAVAFLLSDEASYITGATLAIDGGSSAVDPTTLMFYAMMDAAAR